MDKAELRRLAEVARKFYEKAVYDADESQTWEDFVEYCNPAAIIELLDEIAAANARIAELEANLQYAEFVRKEFESALMNNDNAVEAYKYWRQRAEQAEEKVKRLIKKITFNTPRLDNFGDNEYLLSIDENDIIPAEPCVCDKMEQAEAQAAAMRVCGNCRHYSQGYTDDYCVKDCSHGEKETRRGNTCRDWEMI